MKQFRRDRPDLSIRGIALRWAGALLLAGLLAGPGFAAPKRSKTPGEICSSAGSLANKVQCCEEAFLQCLQGCPKGESGPKSSCGNYCDKTVRQACLQEAIGRASSANPTPKPQLPAAGGVLDPRRPGATKPGRASKQRPPGRVE